MSLSLLYVISHHFFFYAAEYTTVMQQKLVYQYHGVPWRCQCVNCSVISWYIILVPLYIKIPLLWYGTMTKHIYNMYVVSIYHHFMSSSPYCHAAPLSVASERCRWDVLVCVLEKRVLCVWEGRIAPQIECVIKERPFSVSKSPVSLPHLPAQHTHLHTNTDSSRKSIVNIPVEKCTGKVMCFLCLTLHVIASQCYFMVRCSCHVTWPDCSVIKLFSVWCWRRKCIFQVSNSCIKYFILSKNKKCFMEKSV